MKNMSAVTDLAANIRLLLMDVDGVLTDGKVYDVPDPAGNMVETKGFDTQDGIALQWLSWKGFVTGVISGRVSPATEERAKQCNMTYVYQGHIEKIPILEEILKRIRHCRGAGGLHRRRSHRCGGDESGGLEHCPGQRAAGSEAFGELCDRERGRPGAVREVCELLLKAQGHWDELLRKYEIRGPRQ